MLNEIVLMGRLTRNPELRYTQSNTATCTFSLACERDRKNPDGERDVDFIDCTAWRQTAEFVSKNFSKGSMVVVKGRLQIRRWTSNEGQNRSAPEIMVDNVYFAESKRKMDADERPPFPGDADAPPEMDNTPPRNVVQLFQQFPGTVQYAEDGELPWE